MAFSEFYCNAGAADKSNLYAGSTTGAPLVTYASGTWVQGTGVFTVASGNPITDGVAVGDWASVYPDATTNQAVFIGRVTARDATTITVSLTAKSGTAPVDGTTNTTLVVGGVWQGPTAAVDFPFDFVQSTMMDASSNVLRVNFKSGTEYDITAAIAQPAANDGPIIFSGYYASPGDDAMNGSTFAPAIIDGQGGAFNALTIGGDDVIAENFEAKNTSSVQAYGGFLMNGQAGIFRHCLAHDLGGPGVSMSGSYSCAIECEAFACNGKNAAGGRGFAGPGVSGFHRCYSHDHVTANTHGFAGASVAYFSHCIADECAADGFYLSGAVIAQAISCDAYKNGGHGFNLANATSAVFYLENCNASRNGGWGINGSGAGVRNGLIVNCGGYGNTSGFSTGLSGMREIGTVTYDANTDPWNAPETGDFRIAHADAKGAGRGLFLQAGSGKTGTVAYPDIGAAQQASIVPAIADVRTRVQFGAGGTEYTGSLIVPGAGSGSATLAKETGANARGGSGTCAKLTATSASAWGYWEFYIPVTASTAFTVSFYHKIALGFNGLLKVSIYDTDDTTKLLNSQSVSLTDDEAYHQHTCTQETPTATGFCRVVIEIEKGAAAAADIYIDDWDVV